MPEEHNVTGTVMEKIGPLTDTQRVILADPQTSGGLLISVDPAHTAELEQFLQKMELPRGHLAS